MLKDGYLGEINPRGKEILQAVESDCSRLLRLVNNLLQLSRMEDGIIAMQIGAVDVEALVEYSIDALRFQAKKKEIALQARLSSGLPYIAADFNKASWVITNLIGNALRYTESGGEVIVEAERKGNRVFLKVKDTGVGISPAYHEKIFQKFEQVPGQKGRKEEVPGWACLLPGRLLKHMEVQYGWRVNWVKEPLPVLFLCMMIKNVEEKEVTGPSRKGFGQEMSYKVLVVEDEKNIILGVKTCLEVADYQVVVAETGEEALAEVERNRPDIILLDCFTSISGYQVCSQLKEDPKTKDIPIVV